MLTDGERITRHDDDRALHVKLPARQVDPLVWGGIGAILVAILVFVMKLSGGTMTMAQPIAGGFFTGWLFGNLWNWSGRNRH